MIELLSLRRFSPIVTADCREIPQNFQDLRDDTMYQIRLQNLKDTATETTRNGLEKGVM